MSEYFKGVYTQHNNPFYNKKVTVNNGKINSNQTILIDYNVSHINKYFLHEINNMIYLKLIILDLLLA